MGTVLEGNKGVDIAIDGVAAGKEPRSVAEDLRQMLLEQLTRNSLGIQMRPGQRLADASEKEDVVVDGVLPQSPAAEAGLQKGDVIRKLGAHDVKNFVDLLDLVRQAQLDEKFAVEIHRDGKPLKVSMQIREWQPDYTDVSVEFKSLEDVDQIVMVGGTHLAMAHYTLNVNLKPYFAHSTAPVTASGNRKK
jgi:C-terminal processing protease CtpA/Prc